MPEAHTGNMQYSVTFAISVPLKDHYASDYNDTFRGKSEDEKFEACLSIAFQAIAGFSIVLRRRAKDFEELQPLR
jgi:hypothetical protein